MNENLQNPKKNGHRLGGLQNLAVLNEKLSAQIFHVISKTEIHQSLGYPKSI